MLVTGKPFQHSLLLVRKAGAHPIGALKRSSPSRVAPSLTHKHKTRLERLASDKHSSLSHISINYAVKFYRISLWVLYFKTLQIGNLWETDKFPSKLASSDLDKHTSLLWNPYIENL